MIIGNLSLDKRTWVYLHWITFYQVGFFEQLYPAIVSMLQCQKVRILTQFDGYRDKNVIFMANVVPYNNLLWHGIHNIWPK